MHCTRATGNDVRIHHHVGQSPIAIEWVIEVELDDGLFFLVCQPVIARDFSIVFVSFVVVWLRDARFFDPWRFLVV